MEKINIQEGITSQGVIVYHRTGSHDKDFNLILPPDGFRDEKWSFYGKGVYTCLSPEQLDNPKLKESGPLIVESKVTSVEGYLCLIPELTKSVYRADLSVPEQVAKIFGVSVQAVQSDPILSDELEKISIQAPEDAGQSVKFVAPKIFSKVKGVICNDPNYGPSLIAYNPQTVIPVRYKVDGTEEWRNAGGNRDFYEKIKQFYKSKAVSNGERNPELSMQSNNITLTFDDAVKFATLMGYTNVKPSEDFKVIMSKDERLQKAYYSAIQNRQPGKQKTNNPAQVEQPIAA